MSYFKYMNIIILLKKFIFFLLKEILVFMFMRDISIFISVKGKLHSNAVILARKLSTFTLKVS